MMRGVNTRGVNRRYGKRRGVNRQRVKKKSMGLAYLRAACPLYFCYCGSVFRAGVSCCGPPAVVFVGRGGGGGVL